MVALFSTLLSTSSEQTTTASSSTIPTLVQLFRTSSITLDQNAKLAGHAVLAYQALEVAAPAEGESALFGHKRNNKSNVVQNPNLGVWNCRISKLKEGEKASLADRLMTIPDTSFHFCLTVDLEDPSLVEPTLSLLQQALVRLMIQQPPPSSENPSYTTSLAQLQRVQFGLATEDELNNKSTEESDEEVKFGLMICAIVAPSRNNTKDAYKETQAQNLVLYHLRKFAASLNATLCFVRLTEKGPEETEDQPAMMVNEFAYCWREWVLGNTQESPALYAPGKHQEDLIESVLLRNASCPGHWEASKDSLWKALPPTGEAAAEGGEKSQSTGDEAWLAKLRDSVEAANIPAPKRSSPENQAAPKQDDAAVSSFFENLLKK